MTKFTNEQKAEISKAIGPQFMGGQEIALINALEVLYAIIKPGKKEDGPDVPYVDPEIAANEERERKIKALQDAAKVEAELAFAPVVKEKAVAKDEPVAKKTYK